MYYLSDLLLNSVLYVSLGFAIFLIVGMIICFIDDNKKSKIFKYEIVITRGKYTSTYYTNKYEIKDNVIYFDNICATHFIVEQLREDV